MDLYSVLEQNLYYAGAYPKDENKYFLETKMLALVQKLNKDARDQMKSAIDFLEMNDYKQVIYS